MARPLLSLPVLLEEYSGITRSDEPVTVGIPLPRGAVCDPTTLALVDPHKHPIPLQVQVVARWVDGSMRWALLDFPATVSANDKTVYRLQQMPEPMMNLHSQSLGVQQSDETVVVNTGSAVFFLNPRGGKLFERVVAQGTDILDAGGSRLILTDEAGREYELSSHDIAVETVGPLRATLKVRGAFCPDPRTPLAYAVVRLSFYATNSIVEMQVTLHNPRPAYHRGGLWDLGDKGSLYFQDLSLCVPLRTEQDPRTAWTVQPSQPMKDQEGAYVEIYQDSSGGENWKSTNHVNRFGKVMHTLRGYRVTANESILQQDKRATPVLAIRAGEKSVSAAIDTFWQNFPKALEAHHNRLILRLFPRQYADTFELQGGEQKTHTLYLQFAGRETPPSIGWVHDRLLPRTTPEWYADSRACSYVTPRSQDPSVDVLALVETAIDGPQSFFARREIIDEYGWRHFGDLYADHEAVGHGGETPLIAHYNNQYDVIYGAIVQYLRSGDRRWFKLMHDLARHVIDIDIYHTQEDRPTYNGGLFWHTDHSLDAVTATHRAYSKANAGVRSSRLYGGGPSNEHNYTTGLLYYYFLTGDVAAREAVQGLADWVIRMDDGSSRLLGCLDRRPTGICSATVSRDYHGPGRGAGNSINALLDAYVLTGEEPYVTKAEQLIRRCIHPKDTIQERHLEDVEHRWSYTVFLQALGKYLDMKADRDEIDDMYSYAQASLLHYAEWMLTHEIPYARVLDRVATPTETWPAQDIRKSYVFSLAAKHATEPLRGALRRKAEFFFRTCLRDLRTWKTCALTRPLVLLMTNAYVHAYFQMHPQDTAPQPPQQYDFGQPQQFTPQLYELYWTREKLRGWGHTVKEAGRHLRRIVRDREYRLAGYRG